jgi:3-methyladenine DNA glycosylase/8-oxoguanine DNA glycosylase
MTTWNTCKEKINGLWPKASWNKAERELWQKTLYPLDQWALSSALDKVATDYTREKPALRWVVDAYESIKSESRPLPDNSKKRQEEVMHAMSREIWVSRARNVLRESDRESLERAAKGIKASVNFDIDIDKPIDEWSDMALAFMQAEMENNNDDDAGEQL